MVHQQGLLGRLRADGGKTGTAVLVYLLLSKSVALVARAVVVPRGWLL